MIDDRQAPQIDDRQAPTNEPVSKFQRAFDAVCSVKPIGIPYLLLGFLVVVAPGFFLLYSFDTQSLENLNIVKLLVLSTSLTLPIFMINFVLTLIYGPDFPDSTETPGYQNLLKTCIFASLFSFAVLYPPMYLAAFLGMSIKAFACIVLLIQLCLAFLLNKFGWTYFEAHQFDTHGHDASGGNWGNTNRNDSSIDQQSEIDG